MNSTAIIRLFRLLTLLLFQVLVFNNIHWLGYITPLVIGYMVVSFHRNTPRVVALLWGFAVGLLFDCFSNTAGMATAGCTLIAMIQPPLLNRMVPHDSAEDITPSFSTLGFWNFLLYVLLLMAILHCVFYLLDAFTLSDWPLTLLSILGGTLLSTVIILGIEMLLHTRHPHHT